MVGVLADFIDAGRIKLFTVNSINGQSFYNQGAHPFHRSYVQSVFDSYLREEVVPFIWNNCQTQALPSPQWALRLAHTTPPTAFQASRRHQALLRDVRRIRLRNSWMACTTTTSTSTIR